MTPPQLSEKVRELIKKSRIVSFQSWHGVYPVEVIHRFQGADDQSRYLTDDDLAQIQALSPNLADSVITVQQLRDQVDVIIDEARASVLVSFPKITEPGGGLYPAERANACWRDFWHFLRCITYGIAGQRTDYTSPDGLHHMQLLYQELQVPLDAMIIGLEGIKHSSLKRLAGETAGLEPYFDHWIVRLKQFR